MSTGYMGIDPGVSGGLAIIYEGAVSAREMPDTEEGILRWLRAHERLVKLAVIEWIHPAIHGIDKANMSKLYGNYMALNMALTAVGIPKEIVMPKKWQQGMKIPPKRKDEEQPVWKSRLMEHCKVIYPRGVQISLSVPTRTAITKSTSDALLIATYCRRKCEGTL